MFYSLCKLNNSEHRIQFNKFSNDKIFIYKYLKILKMPIYGSIIVKNKNSRIKNIKKRKIYD
jgi:hypothetical protein